MINLLPPVEKEKISLEKKKRMVVILWLLILFFIVCLILVLFSVKVYFQCQVKIQKTILSQVQKEAAASEVKDFKEKIRLVNSKLISLKSFYQNKIYFSEILGEVSRTLPKNIYLTNLSLRKTEEGKIVVSLSGFSPTRELLFEFKKNLEEKAFFKEVYFPQAKWVKPKDINFVVTFEIFSQ